MTNRDERFFNIAKEMSLLSDYKRARVGAVIVEKNRIISSGHNANKTSPVQCKYNKKRGIDESWPARVHAEIAALTPLLNRKDVDWSHTSIYVYRELKDGSVSCARPCEACAALIQALGIKKIYYSDWDGTFKKEEIL